MTASRFFCVYFNDILQVNRTCWCFMISLKNVCLNPVQTTLQQQTHTDTPMDIIENTPL